MLYVSVLFLVLRLGFGGFAFLFDLSVGVLADK